MVSADLNGSTPPGANPTAAPRIAVVIPHYQDLENLGRCLDCLSRQTLPATDFEVIIADNNSACGLAAVEAVAQGRARVILAREQGAGSARNAGVAASASEFIAFTDSDCRPEPGFLEAGVAALARDDIVGGCVRVDTDDPASLTPSEAYEKIFAFKNERYIREKSFSVTAALFVSRRVFDAVGPFRNGVSEDYEWCVRAVGLGYRLGYAPDALVGHPARRNWAELRKKWRRLTQESYGVALERPLGRYLWLGRSWAVLASILPHTVQIAMSRDGVHGRNKLEAAAVLVRLRLMRFIWAHQVALSSPPRSQASGQPGHPPGAPADGKDQRPPL